MAPTILIVEDETDIALLKMDETDLAPVPWGDSTR